MGFYNRFLFIAKKIYSNKKIIRLLIFLLIFFILFCHNNNVNAVYTGLGTATYVSDENKIIYQRGSRSYTINNFPFTNNFFVGELVQGSSTVYGLYVIWCSDVSSVVEASNGFLYTQTGNIDYRVIVYDINGSTISVSTDVSNHINSVSSLTALTPVYPISHPVLSTFDIYKTSGTLAVQKNLDIVTTKYPEIATSLSDLESLNFDVISINAWDWSNKDFDILFYDRNVKDSSTTEGLYPKRVITLNKNSSYFQADLSADPDTNAIYWIPIDEIGLNLYIGGSYEIRLAEREPLDPPVYRRNLYI